MAHRAGGHEGADLQGGVVEGDQHTGWHHLHAAGLQRNIVRMLELGEHPSVLTLLKVTSTLAS